MRKIFALFLIIAIGGLVKAQNCAFYYPMKEGAKLSYTNYDKKNKITGTSTQEITEISTASNSTAAEVIIKSFDKKDVPVTESTMTVKCIDGVFFVSMERFLTSESIAAYQDMDVEIESDELMFPDNLDVGGTLPDGRVEMSVKNNSIPIMDMTVTVSNRKVEAKEKITTPAGTFDCVKISYDITTDMVVTIRVKAAEWICEDVGMIKSETYNRNDVLIGSTVLTELMN